MRRSRNWLQPPVLAKEAEPVTLAEPSNAADVQLTSPVMAMVRAVKSLVAVPALPVMVVMVTAPVAPLTLETESVLSILSQADPLLTIQSPICQSVMPLTLVAPAVATL